MTELAHFIQNGGGVGEKAAERSLIFRMLISSLKSGKDMPPSANGREEVVEDAGWVEDDI